MASLSDEVDLLRRIPLFAQIEPSKLKLLAFTSVFFTDRILKVFMQLMRIYFSFLKAENSLM